MSGGEEDGEQRRLEQQVVPLEREEGRGDRDEREIERPQEEDREPGGEIEHQGERESDPGGGGDRQRPIARREPEQGGELAPALGEPELGAGRGEQLRRWQEPLAPDEPEDLEAQRDEGGKEDQAEHPQKKPGDRSL